MNVDRKIQDIQTLEQRFEYMFRGPEISISYHRGWFPDFVDLCFEIDAVLGNSKPWFRWVQIKEKFGVCRMYYWLGPDDANDDLDLDDRQIEIPEDLIPQIAAVRQAVDSATRQMKDKCCVCGAFAVVEEHNGWLLTLCNFHFPAARAARGDTRSFYELTAVPATPQDVEILRDPS